jgi:hypothetical protein
MDRGVRRGRVGLLAIANTFRRSARKGLIRNGFRVLVRSNTRAAGAYDLKSAGSSEWRLSSE